MRLDTLLKQAHILVPNWHEELLATEIKQVTDKSHETTTNSIFVAIRGFKHDGHQFLAEAFAKGACCAVVEKQAPINLPQIVVANSRISLAYLSGAIYLHPYKEMLLIGITGTNGKTTTTQLIHHIISQKKACGLVGTVNNKLGDQTIQSTITTPDAPALNRILWEMKLKNISHIAMEVSSHGLELHRVANLMFDIAAVTNISTDHLDLHYSLSHYIQTKQKLFKQIKPKGVAFYNADDPLTKHVANLTKAHLLSFGKNINADIKGTLANNQAILIFNDKAVNILNLAYNQIQFDMPIIGTHNFYNAILAISICLLAGCPAETIKTGLATFPGVHRRLQFLYNKDFKIIDDYAHNPEGIKAAIDAVKTLKPKRLVLVFALRGNRGELINLKNGKTLADTLSTLTIPTSLYVTLSEDVTTLKDKVTLEEHDAFFTSIKNCPIDVKEEPLLKHALEQALYTAKEGDIILLLGAQGMDPAHKLITRHLATTV